MLDRFLLLLGHFRRLRSLLGAGDEKGGAHEFSLDAFSVPSTLTLIFAL